MLSLCSKGGAGCLLELDDGGDVAGDDDDPFELFLVLSFRRKPRKNFMAPAVLFSGTTLFNSRNYSPHARKGEDEDVGDDDEERGNLC